MRASGAYGTVNEARLGDLIHRAAYNPRRCRYIRDVRYGRGALGVQRAGAGQGKLGAAV